MTQVLSQLPAIDDDRVVVGFKSADDSAVVHLDGETALVQTVDFFTPIVDDPYAFGQIAAANAMSDIYAMGATPLFALNIVAFPSNELPLDVLTQILNGGSDKAKEAGISIVGGHSIDDKEPKYGLVVTGRVALDKIVRNSTAHPGDVLILTKPLGTGIIATAIKREAVTIEIIDQATNIMTELNQLASRLMLQYNAHAATDITGFGLLGHLQEMCQASGVSMEVEFNKLPFIDGTKALAKEGVIPGGTKRNLKFVLSHTHFNPELKEYEKFMTADAQTSGGLLIAMSEESAKGFLQEFNSKSNIKACKIGTVLEKEKYLIFVT